MSRQGKVKKDLLFLLNLPTFLLGRWVGKVP